MLPGLGASTQFVDGTAQASLILAVKAPHNRKRPAGKGGALLGLLQGGEICISIYVDPWEVGEPCCVAGAWCGKHRGP
jgi:hypothetical protein